MSAEAGLVLAVRVHEVDLERAVAIRHERDLRPVRGPGARDVLGPMVGQAHRIGADAVAEVDVDVGLAAVGEGDTPAVR